MTFREDATPELRAKIVDLLTEKFMKNIRDTVIREAQALSTKTGISENLLSTWMAQILIEGVEAFRDWEAGEAEAVGESIMDLTAAIEMANRNSYRRKAIHAKEFAEARKVANRTNMNVPVKAYGWNVIVEPRTHNGPR